MHETESVRESDSARETENDSARERPKLIFKGK